MSYHADFIVSVEVSRTITRCQCIILRVTSQEKKTAYVVMELIE